MTWRGACSSAIPPADGGGTNTVLHRQFGVPHRTGSSGSLEFFCFSGDGNTRLSIEAVEHWAWDFRFQKPWHRPKTAKWAILRDGRILAASSQSSEHQFWKAIPVTFNLQSGLRKGTTSISNFETSKLVCFPRKEETTSGEYCQPLNLTIATVAGDATKYRKMLEGLRVISTMSYTVCQLECETMWNEYVS